MVFNKQGQKNSVKGFTYSLDSGIARAGFFQAGVKENANIWVKQYTNKAAFNATDAKFGSVGQVGGIDASTQSPGSDAEDTQSGEFFSAHLIPDGTETKKFATPDQAPWDLTFDGAYLWITADTDDTLRKLDRAGNQFSSIDTPGSRPFSVTWDGNYLWTGDFNSNTIYQIDKTGSEISKFNISFGPRSMTWDGSYLHITASAIGEIRQFKTDGSQVDFINTPSPAGNEGGLSFDGKYFWFSDKDTDTVYQVSKSGSQVSKFSISGFNAHGLAWDGKYLWSTEDTGAGTVYQYTSSASLDLSYQVSGFSFGETFNVSAPETFTMTEDSTNRIFKQENESLTLNDAGIKEIQRTLQESTSLAEKVTKKLGKALSEAISLDDVLSTESSFFRAYNDTLAFNDTTELFTILDVNEQLALNDADIKQFQKLLDEGISTADTFASEADLFRNYQESLTLNDNISTLKVRVAQIAETLTLNDETGLTAVANLAENLVLNDTYSRDADLFRSYNEQLGLTDERASKVSKGLQDSFALNDTLALAQLTLFTETVNLNDEERETVGKKRQESLSLADTLQKTVSKLNSENLVVNDSDVREIRRTLEETVGSNAVYSRELDLFRELTEGFSVSDELALLVKLLKTETSTLSDSFSLFVGKNLSEELKTDDVFGRELDLFRKLSENTGLTAVQSETIFVGRRLEESLSISDDLSRKIGKVASETLNLADEFDFFFSEGPGTPPYYAVVEIIDKASAALDIDVKGDANVQLPQDENQNPDRKT